MGEHLQRINRGVVLFIAAAAAALALAAPAAADTRTETFRFPVTIGGYQVKQDMTFDVAHPQVNGAITHMSVNVVDDNGAAVPIQRIMLHHIVFSVVGRHDSSCSQFTGFDHAQRFPGLVERFYAAGEERNQLTLPPGYGYRIGASDHWLMTWMLMNHRRQTDHANIEWKVTYDTNPALTPVHPYWLDEANCNSDPVFDVPGGGKPGSTFSRTYDMTMPESGRIVAAGGHVHGGAKNLVVSQPDCGNRKLFESDPAWGMPDNAFYHVRPVLHEPGPIAMSGMLSSQGYPVSQGQRIRLTANYDDSLPHMRVMGIEMIYVAPSAGPVDGCGPTPADARSFQTPLPHRTVAPRFTVPLTGIDSSGRAVTISAPPGRRVALASGSSIDVRNFFFSRPNVVVKRGAMLNWLFQSSGGVLHNVTLADGPRGFSSPNQSSGVSYSYRFRRRGTYRLFCALHPVSMTETVVVR